jgi:hypothetical protein
MRTVLAILAVCGVVSAGNLFSYQGTSHYQLG